MITLEQVISIGTITRSFGKQGAILCRTTHDYWEQAQSDWLILSLDHILVPFRVKDWFTKGADGIVFELQDIDSEEQALPLLQAQAYMLRSDLAQTDEDEMAWTDLIGYTVIDTDQGPLGTITAIDDTTDNILATLNSKLSTTLHSTLYTTLNSKLSTLNSTLIPLHEDFIVAIDDKTHILTITLPYLLQ